MGAAALLNPSALLATTAVIAATGPKLLPCMGD